MNRQEAAEYLGVSVRTLERLASDGRIAKGRVLRKTRPAVDYSVEDLDRLKADLSTKQEQPIQQEFKQGDTVAFRLDPLYVRRLTISAHSQGMSAGEYARHLVIRSLEDSDTDRFVDEVHKLREGLADTVHLFLTTKCATTEAEADTFVRETILREG